MQGQEYSYAGERTMRIKRVDPVSVAKVQGIYCASIALLLGAFWALFAMIGLSTLGREGGILSLILGVGAIVIWPVGFGIAGFIGGLISALIYNLIASVAGGIEIVVE